MLSDRLLRLNPYRMRIRNLIAPLSRRLIPGVLILAVLLRGLIPAGFMPSAEHPFTLELCPDGIEHASMGGMDMAGMDMPGMDMSGQHAGDHLPASHHDSHTDHCVFGAAATAGIGSAFPQVLTLAAVFAPLDFWAPTPLRPYARSRAQQPRAPPSLV